LSSSLTKYPGPGCIVEFMQGNQAVAAWVLEESGGRLRVYTIGKRESKMPSSRALPWAGPCDPAVHDRSEMLERLCAHNARREKIAESVDPMEIWEMAQGEVTEESAEWFAGLLWESAEAADADHVAALGRALLECKTHFKFHPPKFEVYSGEQVERRMAEQELAVEREKVVTAGKAFFKDLWTAWASGKRKDARLLENKLDPEAAKKLKNLLMTMIARPDDNDSAQLWGNLRKGLPEHPYQALILAEQWGVVPPHYNYLIDEAGYETGDEWAARHADEIAAQRARYEELRREPEDIPFVSVDSASTRDIDDAFYVEALPDGGFLARLALADPALTWEFGGGLDAEVFQRASSFYLPEGVCHMLPEDFGIGLYSLSANGARPALVLEWDFSADGAERDFRARTTWVQIAANRTYADVEEELSRDDCADHLRRAHALAGLLRENRLAAGAVIIERPEPEIKLEGYPDDVRVELSVAEPNPMAQLIVSEFMILANSSVGRFASERGLPLLFRTQDAVVSGEARGVKDNPADIHATVKQLPPTLTELDPRPHVCLGATAYSPITSPLRRYADLVNLAQFRHYLATGEPRFTRQELEARLPEFGARVDAVGRIQRFRPRYWKLLYLRQRCRERMFSGVAVDEAGGYVTLSLPDLQIYVRAPRDMLGEKISAGQPYQLRLGRIDPLTNEIRVLEAMEE